MTTCRRCVPIVRLWRFCPLSAVAHLNHRIEKEIREPCQPWRPCSPVLAATRGDRDMTVRCVRWQPACALRLLADKRVEVPEEPGRDLDGCWRPAARCGPPPLPDSPPARAHPAKPLRSNAQNRHASVDQGQTSTHRRHAAAGRYRMGWASRCAPGDRPAAEGEPADGGALEPAGALGVDTHAWGSSPPLADRGRPPAGPVWRPGTARPRRGGRRGAGMQCRTIAGSWPGPRADTRRGDRPQAAMGHTTGGGRLSQAGLEIARTQES